MSLRLSAGIFLCKSASHYVFLNLLADEYICVRARDLDHVLPWISGQSSASGRSITPFQEVPDDILAMAKPFLERGLMSIASDGSEDVFDFPLPVPRRSLHSNSGETSTLNAMHHYGFRFVVASSLAHLSLSRDPIARSVSRVARRRRASSTNVWSYDYAAALVSSFEALRIFFPRRYLCLFDSLALLNFLSQFDVYPNWVFGVRAEPFAAHCWVQWEDIVLNDTVENVCCYNAIMIV